jgi:adenylate cyclase
MTEHPGGALIDLSFLFIDIRGSTRLAEGMPPSEYARLINRFYEEVTRVLVRTGAFIDKFVGDEVMAVFLPVFCGPNHARAAVDSALELLRATGRPGAENELPVGVGVNTGNCYFGTVKGVDGTFTDWTALGDPVNVAARLAAAAVAGEALISDATCRSAGIELEDCERRDLALKGKSRAVAVRVLRTSGGAGIAVALSQPGIEIDDARKTAQVAEITGSKYFRELREQAAQLRGSLWKTRESGRPDNQVGVGPV